MARRLYALLAAMLFVATAEARRNPIDIAGYILDGRIVTAEEFEAARDDMGSVAIYKTDKAKNAPSVLVADTRSGSDRRPSYTWVENVCINGIKALQADNIGQIRKELIEFVRIVPADKTARIYDKTAHIYGTADRDSMIVVTLRTVAADDPDRPERIVDIFNPKTSAKRADAADLGDRTKSLAGRINVIRYRADKQPLIIVRQKQTDYVLSSTSLNDMGSDNIKSVFVVKNSDLLHDFDSYGDTSDGVIIVELRDDTPLPADARRVAPKTAESPQPRTKDDSAEERRSKKPLILVVNKNGRQNVVKTLGNIKAEDVEAITIIKDEDARREYDSLGDTSNGVIIVRFKKGRISEKPE